MTPTLRMPMDMCVHQMFEAQVERTPDSIAVVFEEQALTYRELNTRANRLAHHLRTLGVGPDVPVGLCVERSLELLVGLLGILKAGAAYVPLDPTYPPARLAFMLADAEASVLVTQPQWMARLPMHGVQMVCLDGDWERLAVQPGDNPVSGVTPANLAYVMYTSGSTGQPKGVMIPHSALSNHMHWMQETFALTAADRVVHKTSISFDASVWELFAPLLVGRMPDCSSSRWTSGQCLSGRTARDTTGHDAETCPFPAADAPGRRRLGNLREPAACILWG